jgi:hypothetical protein
MLESGQQPCSTGVGVLHHRAQRLGFGDHVFNSYFSNWGSRTRLSGEWPLFVGAGMVISFLLGVGGEGKGTADSVGSTRMRSAPGGIAPYLSRGTQRCMRGPSRKIASASGDNASGLPHG